MKLPVDVPAAAGQPFIELAREVAAAILVTVEKGWALALVSSNVCPGDGEVIITERLRDGMRQALNAGEFGWKGNIAVLPGTESRSHPEVPVPDGRTDIPVFVIGIFLRFGEHNPHAIIECKRIAGAESRLCREYVLEGVDRFRTGKYGGNHSTGFMIGYLIYGEAKAAVTGINRYLNRNSRGSENLKPSKLVPASWAWKSEHARDAALPIELHHGFLSFFADKKQG